MLFKQFRMRHGYYNLEKKLAKWVKKNLGPEYVDEAVDKYRLLNAGVPIGGFVETATFIAMIERIKEDM